MAATFVLDDETAALVGLTEEVARKEGLPDAALLLRAGDDPLDPERGDRLRGVGLGRLLVGEAAGGLGLGVRPAVAIVEALGHAFVPEPVVAENLAAHALAAAGLPVPDGPLAWGGTAHGIAVRDADLVVGILDAEVVAFDAGELRIVDARDPARPIAAWPGDHVEPRLRAPADVERIADVADVLVAAEAVGVAALAVERTVDYAKEREQFGRAIGSFQAVKHQLADMWAATELARAAVEQAAIDLDSGVAAPASVGAACALTVDGFLDVAARGLHLHGAMGYAWESGCHLFVRRALCTATLLGDTARHRRRALAAFRQEIA